MPDVDALANHPEHRDGGQPPLAADTSAPTEFLPLAATAATVIGPYHLLQRIAEGGMGEVWLAEQKQPVRRRVALKLIKFGMGSREITLRFESERQALALMDHPAIAKVYDAGTAADGRPYFVMEFVPGVAISAFCDDHKLSTRQRLELFVHVCEGVQHAHQKAIIHRDLKPSNILVTEVNGRPAPKIIDFGVAKALSQSLTAETMFTRAGSILGTPAYMSPEQASSGGEDIDTRSDVYSLGVMLYELLARVPPLDVKTIPYFELVRKIREDDTPKPSTKVRSIGLAAEKAGDRRAERLLLAKELRGDLDCITLKCLEKDRSRRYGSPAEIAADIDRYLQNLPVLAASPSAAYRLQKFAKRNRGLLAAICAVLLVLVAGTLVSIYLAVRARTAEHAAIAERDRADAEASTARAVNEFLQDDLLSQAGVDQQHDPNAAPDPDVRVRTLVDRAAAAIAKKFAGKPMIEGDLRATLGNTYVSLGLLKEAEDQLQRGYELTRRTRGPAARQTIDALHSLASAEFNNGQYNEAARHQVVAVDSARSAFGPENAFTLMLTQSLATDYLMLGNPAKAEPLLKGILATQLKSLGYDNADTLNTSDSLATLYLGDGRYAEAQKLLERGLISYKAVFGSEHPNTMRERHGLARVLFAKGEYAEAEQMASAVYESNRRLLGASHFKTLSAGRMLARIYAEEGKAAAAETLMVDTLRQALKNAGKDNVEALYAKDALAMIYEKESEYAKAEAVRREEESVADGAYGASSSNAILAKQLLGNDLWHQHRCKEAEPYLRAANQRWQTNAATDWHRFAAQALLGSVLACENKPGEAEPLLLSGYRGLKESSPKMPANEQHQTAEAADQLALLQKGQPGPAKQ